MKKMLVDLIEKIMNNVEGSNSASLIFSQENIDVVAKVWDYFALIGIGATLIYFLLEMNRKFALEGGDLTIKSFFAPFLKLMIAIAVLSQGGKILGLILTLNNHMVDAAKGWFANSESPLGEAIEMTKEEIDGYGLMKLLSIVIPLLLCFVVSMVLKLIWWYKGILYKLEVLFRIGIAPISFADVYSGQNSNAVRYLKGFLVLGIYGAALVILPNLSMQLSVTTLWNTAESLPSPDGVWEMITRVCELAFLAPFAALSCASAARTAAKEALGA